MQANLCRRFGGELPDLSLLTRQVRQERENMISFIRGRAVDRTETSVVLETGGIGFEIFMTGSDLSRIRVGEEAMVHTYFQVREDAMTLFGFLQKDDLQMFRLLLGVSGIGPKGALGVLSAISADELRFAVLSDDVRSISKAPGIGKKTAQKLILEIKDKLSLEEAFEQKLAHGTEGTQSSSDGMSDAKKEAVEALTALGYSGTEALRAVRAVDTPELGDVEAILKAALKKL